MKVKLWFKYLTYIIILFILIFLLGYVGQLLESSFMEVYYTRRGNTPLGYITISLLIGISIGAILGFDHFFHEMRKSGIWKISFSKLILWGLPSLFFSLTHIWGFIWLYHYDVSWLQNFNRFFIFILLYLNYIPLFQVILGYAVITSFYKIENINPAETIE